MRRCELKLSTNWGTGLGAQNRREVQMKTRITSLSLAAMIMIAGCGVPQSDYDKLKSEKEQLKGELDECQNGAEKLVASVDKAFNEKDSGQARHNIELLNSKHPESPKNAEFQILLKEIDRLELEQKKQKEAEEKERKRLENINNTGIWAIGNYVDNFGEQTKDRYITNKESIIGSFSNTATQNSALKVKLLISNSANISIQLYEYAGNNPVKALTSERYFVGIKDSEGNKDVLISENNSDRLSFDKTDSKTVHHSLFRHVLRRDKILENPLSSRRVT
jgi:hypothetical protein